MRSVTVFLTTGSDLSDRVENFISKYGLTDLVAMVNASGEELAEHHGVIRSPQLRIINNGKIVEKVIGITNVIDYLANKVA